MAATVGDFLLKRLTQWDVSHLFGYPGDGINGIVTALGRSDSGIRFIQVRHEEEAAFMASGYAKLTSKPGLCLATSGPGAIHLLNGLYDAKLDRQPVVAIVGQQARSSLGGHFQQEVDLHSLFKDVASEFIETCTEPAQLRHLVDRAIRIARARRSVTAVIIPNDVQEAEAVEAPPHEHGTIHSGFDYTMPTILPLEQDLDRAAHILNAGERVAILIGSGSAGASAQVIALANLLGAGVAKTLLAKTVLSDALPFVTGSIGLLGTHPSYAMMRDCDTLLMIGSTFPYGEFLPKEGQARGVQIDLDPTMLSLRYPMEVSLVGDARCTLEALLPRLQQKKNGTWRRTIEKNVANWWQETGKRAAIEGDPLNPELFFSELSPRLPGQAMLCADTGMSTGFFARTLKVTDGASMAVSGSLATMGPAISYAAAAKFAFPGRPAIAFVGDGAMQMLGINALITVSKYWREWEDPRFIVCVLNNRDLNMVTWELRGLGGSPRVAETQDVPAFDYARYAESLGLAGVRIETPSDIVPGIEKALEANRPVVIDLLADPTIPILPPHVTFEQSKNYFSAMRRGDPQAKDILKHTARQLLASR
jgi:pyruvate dehydrogenase (quinone)